MTRFTYYHTYTAENLKKRLEEIIGQQARETDPLKQEVCILEDPERFLAMEKYAKSENELKAGDLSGGIKYTLSIDPLKEHTICVVINTPYRKSSVLLKITYKGNIPPKD